MNAEGNPGADGVSGAVAMGFALLACAAAAFWYAFVRPAATGYTTDRIDSWLGRHSRLFGWVVVGLMLATALCYSASILLGGV